MTDQIPPGYWIVQAQITDPVGFAAYTAVAGPLIIAAGGRVLARGLVADVVEGQVAGRPYLIEFPSYQAATDCFHGPQYQAAIKLRQDVAKFSIIITQGYLPEA